MPHRRPAQVREALADEGLAIAGGEATVDGQRDEDERARERTEDLHERPEHVWPARS